MDGSAGRKRHRTLGPPTAASAPLSHPKSASLHQSMPAPFPKDKGSSAQATQPPSSPLQGPPRFLQQKWVWEDAEERERGCAEGLAGVNGNREEKRAQQGFTLRGIFPLHGVGEQGMAPERAEDNPNCTISITDGDLQKAILQSPKQNGSKGMDNFFISPSKASS